MIEDAIVDNGKMIRVWHQADAPDELKGLADDPDFALCVVVPRELDEGDWDESFCNLLEYGYIKPTKLRRGDVVVYFTYH